ncbi:MAG: hypothetical protein QOG26_250 [Solirubrobacterales bacterium]|nr:hypothetical protein [Solirubrobacterales bacterium]
MGLDLRTRADRLLGAGLERLVVDHHRRRLSRRGREQALDPDPGQGQGRSGEADEAWAQQGSPPRPGNSVEVLIDGADAFAQMVEAIRGARSHVHIAGWHITPDFALTRGDEPLLLRRLLAETAERCPVRVILWAGAPVPVFKPRRSDVRAVREALCKGNRIQCVLDSRERPMHCHHEKLVIVDDELAFVGGIDLTSLAGDRWDESSHPARGRLGWHDAGTCLRGPAVGDVAGHFDSRWRELTGEALEPPQPEEIAPAGDLTVQVTRTIPEHVYDFAPEGEFSILESHVRALRSAERLIYLESQFLWSPELVSILAEKLAHPPCDEFRLVVLLPANPNNGEDDTRGQLATLVDADDGAHRFLACTIYARTGERSDPLYVHAKVGIVDDRWLSVGSANLNSHSLFNDTEMNLVLCDPQLARRTRLRLWAEHLEREIEEVDGPPHEVVDGLWRPIATEQLQRRERGEPLSHHLVELPGISRHSMRLLGPLQSLLVDG